MQKREDAGTKQGVQKVKTRQLGLRHGQGTFGLLDLI